LAANVAAMEAFAMPLFRAGHVPLVGEWLGLPLATLAGSGSGGLSRSTGGARVRNHRGLNCALPNQRLKLPGAHK